MEAENYKIFQKNSVFCRGRNFWLSESKIYGTFFKHDIRDWCCCSSFKNVNTFHFAPKKNERKVLNSVIEVTSRLPEIAWLTDFVPAESLVACIVHMWRGTARWSSPQLTCGWFEYRYRPRFLHFFKHSLTQNSGFIW